MASSRTFLVPTRSLAMLVASGFATGAAWAQNDADLELRSITLYRSGVGSFELRGTVEDDARARLRFEEAQINDILKSLVLLDLDGGGVRSVGYDSKAPIERRLAGFAIDLSDEPSIADLMRRLRGERIRVETLDGKTTGTILGVEIRETVEDEQKLSEPFVSLLTARGLTTLPVRAIRSFELVDPNLQNELQSALATLAEQTGEKTRAVDLRFTGDGERRVVVGYVHETPVWKTSYRLVLPESERDGAAMQGWAIVENTTDRDWDDVRLSLVSGRPVSFVMDLAEPLFLDRPSVPVPAEIAARPKAFEGELRRDVAEARSRQGGRGQSLSRSPSTAAAAESLEAMTATAVGETARSVATGGEVGETFQYTLDTPVTIERQRSAMLPILTADVDHRRMSIFTLGRDQTHPMRGVEITNTSDLELLPGPITVFDGGAYAGDSIIERIGPGDTRLLTYATDLDVTVSQQQNTEDQIETLSIIDGTLIRQSQMRWVQAFEISNADEEAERTVVLNVPKRGGDWRLERPDGPDGETPSMLRFELNIAADASREFRVERVRPQRSTIALTDLETPRLVRLSKTGAASKAFRDAVEKLQELNAAVQEAESQVNRLEEELASITDEQERIRQNMQAVDRNSELYQRYVRKLGSQEDRLEEIRSALQRARETLREAKSDVREFIRSIDVR